MNSPLNEPFRRLPDGTVRGRIRDYIVSHAPGLGADVLEIGSRVHSPRAWWATNRDLASGKWLGIDMQPGSGVDEVHDAEHLPRAWSSRFSGVLCSEVLEHVKHPARVLGECRRVLAPGGLLVITTLTAFPIHGFPDDYWRFTASGMRLLLEEAGFVAIDVQQAGRVDLPLSDHGEPPHVGFVPMHVFASARAPEALCA